MSRLPTPGSDEGQWGDVLNDFLLQAHQNDGTLKDGIVTNTQVSGSANIALSKLATNPLARANHTGTQTASTISDFTSAAAAAAPVQSVDGSTGVVSLAATYLPIKETLQAHGAMGSTETINLANGTIHTGTLDANCTMTFSGATASTGSSFTLILTQDGAGSHTVTWPAGTKWSGGTPPTLTTTAGAVDILTFVSTDGGTTWFGFVAGKAFA